MSDEGTMKAAVVVAPHSNPVLRAVERPLPAAEETLVTVAAAGIHPVVRAMATGDHYVSASAYPRVVGIDGVGRLGDGRRVYFLATSSQGSLAEQVAIPTTQTFDVPVGLDDAVAAAIVNPGISAWLGLRRAAFSLRSRS